MDLRPSDLRLADLRWFALALVAYAWPLAAIPTPSAREAEPVEVRLESYARIELEPMDLVEVEEEETEEVAQTEQEKAPAPVPPARPAPVRAEVAAEPPTPAAAEPEAPELAVAEPQPKKEKRKKKAPKCVEPTPGVRQVGEGTWAVDEAVVATYTRDLDAASKLAWTDWHTGPEGEVDGFIVKRIKCGSVLDQAGFENGDVVVSVNGRPVTSMAQAIGAFARLRHRRSIEVELVRKGEVHAQRYELVQA